MISRLGDHECVSEYLGSAYQLCESSASKIGEFFILPPQGKQNFWKHNELNIKRLRFLVIFGGMGRFKGAYMGSIIDE